jgi:hypothetical protein
MPILTQPFKDSQKYFIENIVTPAIAENRKLPVQVRKTDSRMICEIAFLHAHSTKMIYRLLEKYGKAAQS